MAKLSIANLESDSGRVSLQLASADFLELEVLAQQICEFFSARVIEKQWDADLLTWLLDIEEERFFLRVEYYSESIWLEAVYPQQANETLAFICSLVQRYGSD